MEQRKPNNRKIIIIVVIVALVIVGGIAAFAAFRHSDSIIRLAQYAGILFDKENLNPSGTISAEDADAKDSGGLPQQKNLMAEGLVTPVKYQSPWGTCWAFAEIGAVESNLIKKGLADKNIDLSERNIAWLAMQHQSAGNGAEKEGASATEKNNVNRAFDLGGNSYLFGFQAMTWKGLSTEEQVPYRGNAGKTETTETDDGKGGTTTTVEYSGKDDWSVPEKNAHDNAYHVMDFTVMPHPKNRDNVDDVKAFTTIIKKAMMKNGAVAIAFNADEAKPSDLLQSITTPYFHETNHAYYHSAAALKNDKDGSLYANHEVLLVGWDDTYSKDNFKEKPPADGAWLVKNSWGESWGNKGMFWLSYYDATIETPAYYDVDLETASHPYDYKHIYQYDMAGYKDLTALDICNQVNPYLTESANQAAVANVFTAQRDETLGAVSTFMINQDTKAKIAVYRLKDDAKNPTDGEKLAEQTQSFVYSGYHRVNLKTPIALKQGDRFSVVVTLTGKNGNELPLEVGSDRPETVELYEDVNDETKVTGTYTLDYKTTAKAGETYVLGIKPKDSDDPNQWHDITESGIADFYKRASQSGELDIDKDTAEVLSHYTVGNGMIKAYTK